jgi:hypothetical protein
MQSVGKTNELLQQTQTFMTEADQLCQNLDRVDELAKQVEHMRKFAEMLEDMLRRKASERK